MGFTRTEIFPSTPQGSNSEQGSRSSSRYHARDGSLRVDADLQVRTCSLVGSGAVRSAILHLTNLFASTSRGVDTANPSKCDENVTCTKTPCKHLSTTATWMRRDTRCPLPLIQSACIAGRHARDRPRYSSHKQSQPSQVRSATATRTTALCDASACAPWHMISTSKTGRWGGRSIGHGFSILDT